MKNSSDGEDMLVELPFPKATLKRVLSRHKLKKETRISVQSLNLLNKFLDELSGWIIREAEQLAIAEGKLTINEKHINQAIELYFGREK